MDRLGAGLPVLRESGETGLLSTSAAVVAGVLHQLGRYDEADVLARESEEHSEPNDIASEAQWRGIRSKLLGRTGEEAGAERLAREGVAIAAATDHLTIHAQALLDLADTLRVIGKEADAAEALREAIALYERKGNVAGAARARRILEGLGSPPAS